jgi:hypothetical protein
MIADTGGDPDVEMINHRGNANHPIYIPNSQELAFPPCPVLAPPVEGHQPIPGLEWKTVGRKQINTLPTIRGNSYAARTKQMTPNPLPKNAIPVAPTTPALMSEQLHTQSTTKAAIVQNTWDALNAHLSITKPKAELIRAYENILASRPAPQTMPSNWTPSPVPSPSAPANNNRLRPPCKPTSDWIIRHLQGTKIINYYKPFNGNTYTMIKAIEACLRQADGEATPPVTILTGKWWSPLSSNFTLMLAGNPAIMTV